MGFLPLSRLSKLVVSVGVNSAIASKAKSNAEAPLLVIIVEGVFQVSATKQDKETVTFTFTENGAANTLTVEGPNGYTVQVCKNISSVGVPNTPIESGDAITVLSLSKLCPAYVLALPKADTFSSAFLSCNTSRSTPYEQPLSTDGIIEPFKSYTEFAGWYYDEGYKDCWRCT